MAVINAVYEISVELQKFVNIDLFQRGFYQLRCNLKNVKKIIDKIEISLLRSTAPNLFPASVVNGQAVGQTFEILYQEESVLLNDVIQFKVSLPLSVASMQQSVSFTLVLELWFIEKEKMREKQGDDIQTAFNCVSRRSLTLSVSPAKGLHGCRPILFEYFHLSAVSICIHISLVGVEERPQSAAHQKKVMKNTKSAQGAIGMTPKSVGKSENNLSGTQKNSESTGALSQLSVQNDSHLRRNSSQPNSYLEEVIFGGHSGRSKNPLESAAEFHKFACRLLLSAYEALQMRILQFSNLLPPKYKIRIQYVDCEKKLEILQNNILRQKCEFDMLTSVESDLILLSGELNLLWTQFLELFRSREEISEFLTKEHHTMRVKRFAEGFFSNESSYQLLASYSNVGQAQATQTGIAEAVRKSEYFASLMDLPLFCAELDGTGTTMPVIFEERFLPNDKGASISLSLPLTKKFSGKSPTNPNRKNNNSQSPEKFKSSLKSSLCLNLTVRQQSTSDEHLSPDAIQPDLSEISTNSEVKKARKSSVGSIRRLMKLLTRRGSKGRHSRDVKVPLYRLGSSACDDRLTSVSTMGLGRRYADRMQFGSMPNLKYLSAKGNSADKTENAENLHSADVSLTIGDRRDSEPSLNEGIFDAKKISTGERRENSTNFDHSEPVENGFVEEETDRNDVDWRLTPTTSATSEPKDFHFESNEIFHTERHESAAEETNSVVAKLSSEIDANLIKFVTAKEEFKSWLRGKGYGGHLASDSSNIAWSCPYFLSPMADLMLNSAISICDTHLIICVHGMDGNSADLRMVKVYLDLALPNGRLEFLMSERNQEDTFTDFESMTRNLVDEILLHLSKTPVQPKRISFVGHSLGTIVIRSALADPRLAPWLSRLHTFLSLNGPHCGILYNSSGVVNMGIWLVQRWKKSASLLQLSLKDNSDIRQTFLYELSLKPGFQFFKYVLLVGSHDDFYVPIHSALCQMSKTALKDTSVMGTAYTEMVLNLLHPLNSGSHQYGPNQNTTLTRYSAYHSVASNSATNSLIGRAAHIAVLDCDVFIEKLLTVSALQYFQ